MATGIVGFGDSITAGYGVFNTDNWLYRLGGYLNLVVTNYAVGGSTSANMSLVTYTMPLPTTDNEYVIMVGTNDTGVYGATNAAGIVACKAFIMNLACFIACPTKVLARNMTKYGYWVNIPVNVWGVQTAFLPGSSLTGTVSGTAVYVSYINFASPGCDGAFTVTIDGVLKGTVQPNAQSLLPNGYGTGAIGLNGVTWAPAVARFGGLSSGSHTVVVTSTSASSWVFIDWIAGSTQASKPHVRVADVIKKAPAIYTPGNSDNNVANYSAAISALCTELTTDGLNVKLASVTSSINPLNDLQTDGTHPRISGHEKILDAFQAATF